ncbi:TetR family transcriptional regulator [Rathayibacter sp. YIM 133350]|uniref:TetR family transcriptional regulator n=1 Tax=Rathayibacter sp. YIM 133350 TaxID=3131992 RepID=UPI00307D9136
MGRWEADAHGRLRLAALELFAERGFEGTTVAHISERAGVTERTFFRYFPDKREVLFDGSEALVHEVVGAILAAPAERSPFESACAALAQGGSLFASREFSRKRSAAIAGNPGLLERELLKMAALSTAISDALQQRGVSADEAALAAEAAVTVFKLAFERWISLEGAGDFAQCSADVLARFRTLTARP